MSTELQTKTANPGPLGLLGFGMTTVLLNLVNSGLDELSIVVLAIPLLVPHSPLTACSGGPSC